MYSGDPTAITSETPQGTIRHSPAPDASLARVDAAFLLKKYMCKCPICGQVLTGKDLFGSRVPALPARPFTMTYCHAHTAHPPHAITLFFDQHQAIRSIQKSDFLHVALDPDLQGAGPP